MTTDLRLEADIAASEMGETFVVMKRFISSLILCHSPITLSVSAMDRRLMARRCSSRSEYGSGPPNILTANLPSLSSSSARLFVIE